MYLFEVHDCLTFVSSALRFALLNALQVPDPSPLGCIFNQNSCLGPSLTPYRLTVDVQWIEGHRYECPVIPFSFLSLTVLFSRRVAVLTKALEAKRLGFGCCPLADADPAMWSSGAFENGQGTISGGQQANGNGRGISPSLPLPSPTGPYLVSPLPPAPRDEKMDSKMKD